MYPPLFHSQYEVWIFKLPLPFTPPWHLTCPRTCICIYIPYMHTHTRTHIHTHAHAHTHTHICTCMYTLCTLELY